MTVIPVITSSFDLARVHPVSGVVTKHLGTDFRAPVGAFVKAVKNGTVVRVRTNSYPGDLSSIEGRTGNHILVRHDDGLETYYGHTKPSVSAGQKVKCGQIIGSSDGSGNVKGAHLHFEVRVKGIAVDPVAYATKNGLVLDLVWSQGEATVSSTQKEDDDMYDDLAAYRDKLTHEAVGRIEMKLYSLAKAVNAIDVDVDAESVARSVVTLLTPEKIAEAILESIPSASAEEVADLIAERIKNG